MMTVFLAILPIFLLILIGYVVKNYFLPDDHFWKTADKLVYYLFLPSLLLHDISNAHFASANISSGLMATIGSTLLVAALILLGQRVLPVKDDLLTSIFQGGVRYNSYIFIALSELLFGNAGVALSGIFIAYMIVITNVISVIVMNHYGSGSKKGLKSMAIRLVQDPLILAALFGLLLNFLNIHLVGELGQLMKYLGNAAMPWSLMSVGAGLVLFINYQKIIAVIYSIGLKLFLMPIITILLLKMAGASGASANVAMLYASVPCAGNAYILARQMGGDAEAMASIITWLTLVSALSITLFFGMFQF